MEHRLLNQLPTNRGVEQADTEPELLERHGEGDRLRNHRNVDATVTALLPRFERQKARCFDRGYLEGDAGELERGRVVTRKSRRVVPERGARAHVGDDRTAGQRDVDARIHLVAIACRRGAREEQHRQGHRRGYATHGASLEAARQGAKLLRQNATLAAKLMAISWSVVGTGTNPVGGAVLSTLRKALGSYCAGILKPIVSPRPNA